VPQRHVDDHVGALEVIEQQAKRSRRRGGVRKKKRPARDDMAARVASDAPPRVATVLRGQIQLIHTDPVECGEPSESRNNHKLVDEIFTSYKMVGL
jgi:hypothetical protein